jgi:hypothetical protein
VARPRERARENIAVPYLFIFGIFLIAVGAVVAAGVGYARLMRGIFAREDGVANVWRFATYFVLSLHALVLHTFLRLGAVETAKQYPFYLPEMALILLFLGCLALANVAVLIARHLRLSSESQICAGVSALFLGGVGLTVLHLVVGGL